MSLPNAEVAPRSASETPAAVLALGRFVFRFRDYLTPLGLAAVLVFTQPEFLFGSPVVDRWTDVLGFLIAATGQALRMAVIGYAYIVRGGVNKQLAAPKLVCQGFYAHSRNPMYLGNFLLLAGLAIIYNSPWVYLLVLPLYYGGLFSIIKAEESFLRGKFGAAYEAYCRTSNRFWPRRQGLRATLASMRYDWKRALRKEYGTTMTWLSIAIFLLIWERVHYFGYEQAKGSIHVLLACYVPVLAYWGGVRWLKKTRRLRS